MFRLNRGTTSPEVIIQNGKGQEIVSIDPRSVHMFPGSREKRAQMQRTELEIASKYLGEFAAQTAVEIDRNPFNAFQKAIVYKRPYRPMLPLEIFSETGLDENALNLATSEHPHLRPTLHTFAQRGLELAEEEKIIPDVNNVFVPYEKMIDPSEYPLEISGLPVHENDETFRFQIISEQLSRLVQKLN